MGLLRVRPALRHWAEPSLRLAGGVGYDADAVTLFAAMSVQPDATRKGLINTMITDLKAAGIWTELDELWVMAAHVEQAGLLGWKRYKDLTAVNAPTFEADRGIAGNGTTSYLNTNYTPSTDGVQYTLNDASFGVYSRTDLAQNSYGIGGGSTNPAYVIPWWTDNTREIAINSGGFSAASTTSLGLTVARRTASNAVQIYRNGAQVATSTTASGSLTADILTVAARNRAGAQEGFSTRQHAFAFVGASLSAQQQADLYTHVQAYLTAIGAAV